MDNYNTKAQRERSLIALLDEKLDYIKDKFSDKIHLDKKDYDGPLLYRILQFRLGNTEYHFMYNELSEVPGSASYRIRTQPAIEHGVGDKWVDLVTLGTLDSDLRRAKKERGPNSGDVHAQRNNDKNNGPVPDNIILAGLSGSLAYNLDHNGYVDPESGEWVEPSDVDLRGVFVVPTKEVLSLGRHKELVEQKSSDTKFDEIERFMTLCLNCNPERLEMLATSRDNGLITSLPPNLHLTPGALSSNYLESLRDHRKSVADDWGKLLVDNQNIFLSRQVINRYGGYSKSQLQRIESKKERKTKPAMHLIRLMITVIRALKECRIDASMSEYRDQMMAIRTGEMPIEQVFKWHRRLEKEFADAIEYTKLPEEPNYTKANEILLDVRCAFLKW